MRISFSRSCAARGAFGPTICSSLLNAFKYLEKAVRFSSLATPIPARDKDVLIVLINYFPRESHRYNAITK